MYEGRFFSASSVSASHPTRDVVYVFSNGSLACTRPDCAVWGMPRRIELALFAAGYICINVVYHFGKEYHRSYSPQEIAITLNAHSDQWNNSTTATSLPAENTSIIIAITPDAAENFAFNFTEDLWDIVGLTGNHTIQASLSSSKRPNLQQHAAQCSNARDIFTDNVTKSMHSLKTRLLRNSPEGSEDRGLFFDLIASLNKLDIARATASTVARKRALGLSSITTVAEVITPAMVSNGSKRKSSSGDGKSRQQNKNKK